MAVDPEHGSWLGTMVGGLGLTSTALGGWVLKMSGRMARIEQKIDDMIITETSREKASQKALEKIEHDNTVKLDRIESTLVAIRKHITGTDL